LFGGTATRSSVFGSLLITCVPGGGLGIDRCGAGRVGWRETERLAGCSGAAPERGLRHDRPGCRGQAEDRCGERELVLRRVRARVLSGWVRIGSPTRDLCLEGADGAFC
jgi:hypothetical protein